MIGIDALRTALAEHLGVATADIAPDARLVDDLALASLDVVTVIDRTSELLGCPLALDPGVRWSACSVAQLADSWKLAPR